MISHGSWEKENLADKKNVLGERGGLSLIVAVTNSGGFKTSGSCFIGIKSRILAMKNACYIILPSPKYRRLVHKKSGSRITINFRPLAYVKRHIQVPCLGTRLGSQAVSM